MRRLTIALILTGLACPLSALAGTHVTSITATHERGVIVYRGQPSEYNYQVLASLQKNQQLREERAKINSRLAAQERANAAQDRRLDSLQSQLARKSETAKPKRRSRYGRSYRGNNRFFGRNGFIGNSNFSGATQPLPESHRHLYQRRHR